MAPIPCYATFPVNKIGKHYDKLREEVRILDNQEVLEWEYGDWAVGVPPTVDDQTTYKILKDFENKIVKGKLKNEYKERCN